MHLNAHSYFSLRYGTLSPEKLVDEAVARAVTVLALTDINNSSAAFPFVQACRKAGIKPVLGIEFRCEGRFRYLGIARNREGWRELCRHLSDYQNTGAIGERAPHWDNAWVVYRKCPVPVEELRDSEWIGIRPGELNALYSSPLSQTRQTGGLRPRDFSRRGWLQGASATPGHRAKCSPRKAR